MNTAPFWLIWTKTELFDQSLNNLLDKPNNFFQRKILQHRINDLSDQAEHTLGPWSFNIIDKRTPNIVPESKSETILKHHQPTIGQAKLSI